MIEINEDDKEVIRYLLRFVGESWGAFLYSAKLTGDDIKLLEIQIDELRNKIK